LLFEQGKYDQAAVQFQEAIRHYPNSLNVLAMREKLGNCYRKLADQELNNYGKQDPPQSAVKKSFYWATYRERLEQARDVFQKLVEELDARAQSGQLTGSEEKLLLKSQFLSTDYLCELGNAFPEALRRYELLAKRYQGRVWGLYACQGLWKCYNAITEAVMKRQAREVTAAALDAARSYLSSLSESDPFFYGPGNEKADWVRWVNFAHGELTEPPSSKR
jgi:tetratricopeptide (TPR) repeat protein